MECCPSPSLGNMPRILWLVRGRGCSDPEPWGWVGCIRAGVLSSERVLSGRELGVHAVVGRLPSVGHLCPGLWFVGSCRGICRRNKVLRWRRLAPAAASVAIVLRPRGQIRWREASSGPERLFCHVDPGWQRCHFSLAL